MGTLADHIEAYLKQLLDQLDEEFLEIKRTDLAARFACVPSQINYVLKTRFTAEQGYVVESRRGEGGYIRIIRLQPTNRRDLYSWILEKVGTAVSEGMANQILSQLQDTGLISTRHKAFVQHIVQEETSRFESPWSDILRASLLRGLLTLMAGIDSE
jgi:transcriptional regulator CtsR